MKTKFFRINLISIIFVLFLSVASFALDINSLEYPPLKPIKIPEVKELTLPNGLRLYLLEDKTLPTIELFARVRGGSYLEPKDKVGLASLCGDLMDSGGTEKWSSNDFEEMLESIGATANVSIDTIAGNLNIFMLSNYTELALEVMAQLLRKPAFEEDRFNQLLISYRSMVSRRNDSAERIAQREFEKIIYGADSPYARHPEYATLDAITRKDLIEFHSTMFRPENVQLAIYGDIDSDNIIDLVNQHFLDWEKSKTPIPAYSEVSYEFTPSVNFVNIPGATQSNIFIGHLGGNIRDEDNPHRIVFNHIFGLGFGSRLFKQVRSRAGLAYSVYGYYGANASYLGMYSNFVSTKTSTTLKAIKMIIEQIKLIQKEPPTLEEVNVAKDKYLNTFVFNYSDKGKILNRMIYYDCFDLPRDFLNTEMLKVRDTTPQDVMEVAKKYLKPESLRVLVVGDYDGFEEPLQNLNLGDPQEVDIRIPD